ncbi:hypothetical protein CLOSBL3_12405 [Clostridiaceae bacterium BL-3]|nr:hypothetical protein CLOSBL3_12405 [Clostridiaceae bacterium BL-3]
MEKLQNTVFPPNIGPIIIIPKVNNITSIPIINRPIGRFGNNVFIIMAIPLVPPAAM